MRAPSIINLALVASLLTMSAVLSRPAVASWREEQRLSRIDAISEMDTRTLAGAPRPLRAGESTLYVVVSPNCKFSDAAAAEWSRVLARDTTGLKVVGVVYDIDAERDVRAFVAKHNLAIDVVKVPFAELAKATGVRMVPSVIAADAAGAVRFVGQGRGRVEPSDSVFAALRTGGRG